MKSAEVFARILSNSGVTVKDVAAKMDATVTYIYEVKKGTRGPLSGRKLAVLQEIAAPADYRDYYWAAAEDKLGHPPPPEPQEG